MAEITQPSRPVPDARGGAENDTAGIGVDSNTGESIDRIYAKAENVLKKHVRKFAAERARAASSRRTVTGQAQPPPSWPSTEALSKHRVKANKHPKSSPGIGQNDGEVRVAHGSIATSVSTRQSEPAKTSPWPPPGRSHHDPEMPKREGSDTHHVDGLVRLFDGLEGFGAKHEAQVSHRQSEKPGDVGRRDRARKSYRVYAKQDETELKRADAWVEDGLINIDFGRESDQKNPPVRIALSRLARRYRVPSSAPVPRPEWEYCILLYVVEGTTEYPAKMTVCIAGDETSLRNLTWDMETEKANRGIEAALAGIEAKDRETGHRLPEVKNEGDDVVALAGGPKLDKGKGRAA